MNLRKDLELPLEKNNTNKKKYLNQHRKDL